MKAYSLNIGLTNRCNLNCSFCPVSKTKIGREDMPIEMARKIISEVDVEHHISLALFGESTLYKDLPEVIRLIKKKKVQSILYTNGLNIDGIAGLDKVVFSIDAFDKEDYIRIKGFDGYDIVNKNMLSVPKGIHVTVQFAGLVYHTPKEEIARKLNDLRKKVDRVKLGRYVTWGGEVDWQSPIKRTVRERKPCNHLFRFINIASNGDFVQCCFDYNHSVDLGNVMDGNIMDTWNGKKFNDLRESHIDGKFSTMCLQCENENYYSSY